jgi:hypothetical protein
LTGSPPLRRPAHPALANEQFRPHRVGAADPRRTWPATPKIPGQARPPGCDSPSSRLRLSCVWPAVGWMGGRAGSRPAVAGHVRRRRDWSGGSAAPTMIPGDYRGTGPAAGTLRGGGVRRMECGRRVGAHGPAETHRLRRNALATPGRVPAPPIAPPAGLGAGRAPPVENPASATQIRRAATRTAGWPPCARAVTRCGQT